MLKRFLPSIAVVRNRLLPVIVVLVGLITALSALASDLKAPFELENTLVLPPSVRNPRMKNLFMSVEGKFNRYGIEEPLGAKLNKRISWQDIVDSQQSAEDKALVAGTLESEGMSLESSPGRSTGEVKTFADVKIPVIAWGASERWTLAAAVPMYRVQVRADTGFVRHASNGEAQRFIEAVQKDNPEKANEAARKLQDPVNQKLTRLGYKNVRSETFSGVGDIRLVSKYLLSRGRRTTVAMRNDVTLPTGRAPDVDRALDIPMGDGQLDLGTGLIVDHQLTSEFRLNAYGSYVAQLPDRMERRAPTSATDSLSDQKENMRRDLGDQITLGSSLNYDLASLYGLSAGAGYSFQFQRSTSFSGSRFSREKYQLLEQEFPLQALHAMTYSLGFSTVEWFRAKKFAVPFQANVSYSVPFIGRNVTTNNVVAAELVMFF